MKIGNNSSLTNSSFGGTESNDVSFDNLYPALVQCFFIILVGYVAGRINILSSSQGKGIGTFVSTFCLPALLFKNMCLLNFDTVNWMFLLSIFTAKTVVFVLVAIVTLLAKRPLNYGYAGIFAIFVTQSNDFALGYPILEALYKTSHPEYLDYIYLIAPISLTFLNPIGFAMLEIQKRKSQTTKTSRCKLFLHVLKAVITNPIVFMTFIGIIGNFVFQHNIPLVILDILNVLGNAFNATALFYLGLSLVGKVQGQSGLRLVVPLLLIGVKTLFLPLITWQIVGSLDTYVDGLNDTISMSMYGFLYGTFPTAPSVFLYASHYGIAMDTIATGMVAGTLLSAPIMFVSAKMMTVMVNNEMNYKNLLLEASVSTSIISVVGYLWVLFVFVFSKRYKRVPHQFLLLFFISHMMSCFGMIISGGEVTFNSWEHYVTFSMISVGVLAARCYTAVIAISLYLIHSDSLCVLLRIKWWLFILPLGLPILATVGLFLTECGGRDYEEDPSFLYGECQSVMLVVFLTVCSIVNITCLVLKQRHHHSDSTYQQTTDNLSSEQSFKMNNKRNQMTISQNGGSQFSKIMHMDVNDILKEYQSLNNTKEPEQGKSDSLPGDICSIAPAEALSSENSLIRNGNRRSICEQQTIHITCRSTRCNNKQKTNCEKLLAEYYKATREKEFEGQKENPSFCFRDANDQLQSDNFILFLVTAQISIFFGLFLYIWRLFNNRLSGIYIEIEFLDCVFNYGQGFLVCALFGFDTKTIFLPFIKRFRRLIYGAEIIRLPSKENIDDDIVHLCNQFVKYHMVNCMKCIVKDRKYRLREYKQVFTGIEMCDWLIEIGLASDRGEAIGYGKSLLIGRVIRHTTSEHHFYDLPYFYKFVSEIEANNYP